MQRSLLIGFLLVSSISNAGIVGGKPATPPSGPAAPAPLPSASRDWQFDPNMCVASTTVVAKTASYRLEVAADPAKIRPVEIKIVPSAELTPSTLGITFAFDKKTTYAFSPIAQDAAGLASVTAFWNIPRGTQALIAYLKRESKMSVTLNDGTTTPLKVAFSLRGSTDALAKLQKNCNSQQELAADGFERAFLPATVATVDPSKLKVVDTQKLRELIAAALTAFRSSNTSQTQLNALSAKFLKQITEFQKLRTNVDKLQTGTVAKLNAKKAASQANIDRANIEMPQLKATVVQQEAALTQANAAVDAAKADIAPLLPALNQYRGAVSNAEANQSQAQSALGQAESYESQTRSRLQQIINGIAQVQSDIDSIQRSIGDLRPRLQSAQYEADQARREYSDAEGRRQRYDRNYELSSRLSRNSQLSSIESELRSAESQADQARSRASSAQSQKDQADNNLRTCRSTIPSIDCSAAQSSVSSAESALNSANSDVSGAESRKRDLQNQAAQIRSSVGNDVDREYNQLVSYERDAQRKYDNAQSNANDIQNRIQRLYSNDLPQAQNTLSSLQSARPGAENDINGAVQSVSRARRELANANGAVDRAQARLDDWRVTSGYNTKRAVLTIDQQNVDVIQTTLSQLDKNILKDEKLIRDETKTLADVEKQMQAVMVIIAQKEARSAEVQKILAPYFQQRDVLAATKATADLTFKTAQTDFASRLPQ